MKITSAKYVVVGLMLAGLLPIGALLVFLILPTFREVTALSDRIVTAESELQAQYANRKNLVSSVAQIDAAKATAEKLGSQFFAPGDALSFISAIEGAAGKNGVDESLRLSGDVPKPLAENFSNPFELTLGGAPLPVLKTILDIERLPQIVIFHTVDFRAAPGGAVSADLQGLTALPPKGL